MLKIDAKTATVVIDFGYVRSAWCVIQIEQS